LGDADWIRSAATQELRLAPDVILANGTPAAKTMQQTSRTVPVTFIAGSDPVLDGLVLSLAHPGGNLTGFYVFEPSLGAKLLELLKEMAPHVARVAILSNPDVSQVNWHASVAPAAARLAVEVVVAPLRDSNEIEAVMAQWGLISYGPYLVEEYRRAATYADLILKGEKPAELPVQAPVKYETVINLKTAKALGLTVPNTLLVAADEVIE
jgi:putative tryptophan/tyrosine transport system substrate-binding protein